MKWDEFAFFNQQLSRMISTGIPLEGALRQLCQNMRAGSMQSEIDALHNKLAQGMPLPEALAAGSLPTLYVRMVIAGQKGNNLPGILNLLADYYRRMDSIWIRLKSLMVYPAIVLGASLVIFSTLSVALYSLGNNFIPELLPGTRPAAATPYLLLLPMLFLFLFTIVVTALVMIPRSREWLRWRIPGFKEAECAQFGSTMKLMLQNGTSLPEALQLMKEVKKDTLLGLEISQWSTNAANGKARFEEMVDRSSLFPPLFLWLVSSAGEDVESGFAKAADIFYARAVHRIEMMLYAALPVAVVILGFLIMIEVGPIMASLFSMIDMLGSE